MDASRTDCGMNSLALLGFQSVAFALNALAALALVDIDADANFEVDGLGIFFHGEVDADSDEDVLLKTLPIPFPPPDPPLPLLLVLMLVLMLVLVLLFPQTEEDPKLWVRFSAAAGGDNDTDGFHSFACVESFPNESARSSIANYIE